MEMSALRFATTEQGVVQVVGTSSPLMTASAPEGVDEMAIFSVVPRVTDAQPPSRTLSVTIPKIRMELPPFAAIKRNGSRRTSCPIV